MSSFIKNGDEWCQVDPIQPSHDEIEKTIRDAGRPWYPRLRGLKLTKCGALIGGPTHPIVRDACPMCEDCIDADNV